MSGTRHPADVGGDVLLVLLLVEQLETVAACKDIVEVLSCLAYVCIAFLSKKTDGALPLVRRVQFQVTIDYVIRTFAGIRPRGPRFRVLLEPPVERLAGWRFVIAGCTAYGSPGARV